MKENEKLYGEEYWEFLDCDKCGEGKLIPDDDSHDMYTCECCGAVATFLSGGNGLIYVDDDCIETYDELYDPDGNEYTELYED